MSKPEVLSSVSDAVVSFSCMSEIAASCSEKELSVSLCSASNGMVGVLSFPELRTFWLSKIFVSGEECFSCSMISSEEIRPVSVENTPVLFRDSISLTLSARDWVAIFSSWSISLSAFSRSKTDLARTFASSRSLAACFLKAISAS